MQYYQIHSNIATNTRPFTNKDYTNNAVYKFGSQRPMRHYRLAKIKYPSQYTHSRSTSTTMSQLMDTPGQNTGTQKLCSQVLATGANFIGDETMVFNNNTCCQGVRDTSKALNLVRRQCTTSPAYSFTYKQYLQKRCSTFEQKSFNFAGVEDNNNLKPGAPNTFSNIYRANCTNCANYSYPESCTRVAYKPNNYQFAKQGAVSSSLRTLKTTLATIQTAQYLNTLCNKKA